MNNISYVVDSLYNQVTAYKESTVFDKPVRLVISVYVALLIGQISVTKAGHLPPLIQLARSKTSYHPNENHHPYHTYCMG